MAAFGGAYVGYLDELDMILDSHLKHRCWKIAMVPCLDSLLQLGNPRHLNTLVSVINSGNIVCCLTKKLVVVQWVLQIPDKGFG